MKEEGRRVHEEEVKSIIKLLWMHRNASKRASYRKLVNGMSAGEQWAHTKGVAKKWGVQITGEEDEDDASEAETRNGRLPWETVGGKKGRGGVGGKEGRQAGQEEGRGKKKDEAMGRGRSGGGGQREGACGEKCRRRQTGRWCGCWGRVPSRTRMGERNFGATRVARRHT